MRRNETEIQIPLKAFPDVWLCIDGNTEGTITVMYPEAAAELGESPWQILEGCFYNYRFEKEGTSFNGFQLRENVVVKKSHRRGRAEGRISPNIYVGSLPLEIIHAESQELIETIYLEVLPTKLDRDYNRKEDLDFRANYEYMLGDIAEKCAELLLQIESPVYQNFEADFNRSPQTVYQRFAFVKSLINTDEFNEAVAQIISRPTTRWSTIAENTDVSSVRRIDRRTARQLVSGSNRIKTGRPVAGLTSLPARIENLRKTEIVDTHENRFVKHVLNTFLQFVRECEDLFRKSRYEKSRAEAEALAGILENHLHHSFFSDISRPTVLKLNSPALQRRSGYREILNAWQKFDLSLKLVWRGGDDVYKAGKRDIAVLYEYWLFFQLYDLMREKFRINQILHQNESGVDVYSHLIEESKDGLQLLLKSGSLTALQGEYEKDNWRFQVRFNYNKTFKGKTKYTDRSEGSWTKPLRPDYTLSMWPAELTDAQAESEERIVHIHFDSKYKVEQFKIPESSESGIEDPDDIAGDPELIDSLTTEKREELKGYYKNADLMKMHAYKDAIRRTVGAYVLYPGTENEKPLKGFHEIIPGLGAFAIRPVKSENGASRDGIRALSKFIDDVIENFKNSASQQKRYAAKTYEVFEQPSSQVSEPLPYKIIPDETYVLVGYCSNQENITGFYEKEGLYNIRMDDEKGAIELSDKLAKARYLLLRDKGSSTAQRLYKIMGNGPRVFSGKRLEELGYISKNLKDFYLVFYIEKQQTEDVNSGNWNFKELEAYKEIISHSKDPHEKAGKPFVVSLTELMGVLERH